MEKPVVHDAERPTFPAVGITWAVLIAVPIEATIIVLIWWWVR